MSTYLYHPKNLQEYFDEFKLVHVGRDENMHVNALAKVGSKIEWKEPKSIPLLFIQWPAVWEKDRNNDQVSIFEAQITWMIPIIDYLQFDRLSNDKIQARNIKTKDTRYSIIWGTLYKRSFSGPYL